MEDEGNQSGSLGSLAVAQLSKLTESFAITALTTRWPLP
jgi:hypothetical protein